MAAIAKTRTCKGKGWGKKINLSGKVCMKIIMHFSSAINQSKKNKKILNMVIRRVNISETSKKL